MTIVGDAYYDEANDQYVLTENETWQAGAIWFSQVRCNDNFSISMDFYTGHGLPTNSYGGADGICVAFYAKGGGTGADGGGLGFDGCGGYGVEVDTYRNTEYGDPTYNHVAILKENVRTHLQEKDATAFTEDGKWHNLKITNRRHVCTVSIDGVQMLQQDGVEPNGQYEIGITAGTGAGYNFHAVRNIQLTEAVWQDASQWADDELERAQQKNLIPTVLYDQDLSKPINRAEFASVAVQLYEQWTGKTAPGGATPFTDISGSRSRADIEKAFALGFTNGYEETVFAPDVLISREQLATMLTRVYKRIMLDGWTLENDSAFPLDISGVPLFSDDAEISEYARPSVYFMVKHSVMNGMPNNIFAPRNTASQEEAIGYATREQALVMSLRSLENLQ